MKKSLKIRITEVDGEFCPEIFEDCGYNNIAGNYKTELAAWRAVAFCLYDEKTYLERKYQKLINCLTKFSSQVLDIL